MIARILHPSALIRDKWSKIWQMERVEGLVLVQHEYHVVRRGSRVTNVFVLTHPELPNNDLYATQIMVKITKEVPEEYF